MLLKKVTPEFTWQDDEEYVYINILVKEMEKYKVDIYYTPEGYISLNLKPKQEYLNAVPCVYHLELHLFDRIMVDKFDWSEREDKIEIVAKKVTPAKWTKLQVESTEVHHNDINLIPQNVQINENLKKEQKKFQSRYTKLLIPFGYINKFLRTFDLLDTLLLFIIVLYTLICPYTKVEESFNLQAMHDILFHRTNISAYDHLEFPGVVPRTFIGPLIISILSSPFAILMTLFQAHKFYFQILVRIILGCMSVICFKLFRIEVSARFGTWTGSSLVLITCSQFHLPFYMSRTLPNTFALAFIMLAYTFWLQERYTKLVFVFTFVVVVFRSELILIFIPIALEVLFRRKISFRWLVFCGVMGTLMSLALTVSIDSIFWKRLLWPEGDLLIFNVVENKSSNYGVSPYYWYFLVALPKLLMGSIFLVPIGLYFDNKLRVIARAVFFFLAVYSILPHKELRFIFYVVPLFNLMAAEGLSRLRKGYITGGKNKTPFIFSPRLIFISFVCLIIISFFISLNFLFISSYNYPGGEAISTLNEIITTKYKTFDTQIKVHIDVLAAQTGVSRFSEINYPMIVYSKEENRTHFDEFDYLLNEKKFTYGFDVVRIIEGFDHIKKSFPNFELVFEDKVFIHEKLK